MPEDPTKVKLNERKMKKWQEEKGFSGDAREEQLAQAQDDIVDYNETMEEWRKLWGLNKPQKKVKVPYAPRPPGSRRHNVIADIRSKLNGVFNTLVDSNPGHVNILARAWHAEEIPSNYFSSHLESDATAAIGGFLKEKMFQSSTPGAKSTANVCEKKLIRVFASVNPYTLTPEPKTGLDDPGATKRDRNLIMNLPQFYGIVLPGQTMPSSNNIIRVTFPVESDKTRGIFLGIESNIVVPSKAPTSGKNAHKKASKSMSLEEL